MQSDVLIYSLQTEREADRYRQKVRDKQKDIETDTHTQRDIQDLHTMNATALAP